MYYGYTERLVYPETTIQETSFWLGEDGKAKDVKIVVKDGSGEVWYEFVAPEGKQFTIVNHRTGKTSPGQPVVYPPEGLVKSERAGSLVDELVKRGMQRVGEDTLNGRAVTVLKTGLIPFKEEGRELRAGEKGIISPVVHDLSPVGYTVTNFVDTEKDTLIGYERYVQDASGTETLVESFEWLEQRVEE